MSFLFRWHRGSLAESMETVREFENVESFKKYLKDDLYLVEKNSEKLGVSYCAYDPRINWDTWYVHKNGYCFGMVNKDLTSKLETD